MKYTGSLGACASAADRLTQLQTFFSTYGDMFLANPTNVGGWLKFDITKGTARKFSIQNSSSSWYPQIRKIDDSGYVPNCYWSNGDQVFNIGYAIQYIVVKNTNSCMIMLKRDTYRVVLIYTKCGTVDKIYFGWNYDGSLNYNTVPTTTDVAAGYEPNTQISLSNCSLTDSNYEILIPMLLPNNLTGKLYDNVAADMFLFSNKGGYISGNSVTINGVEYISLDMTTSSGKLFRVN